ncbi:septum formation protein Maf [bacterium BMS3Abin01]|nr:septum formation protein Maf [bacterium BMS3Abin01]
MYLASKSPQRKALLQALGLDFQVVIPEYSEIDPPGAAPAELVERHSCGKARSVLLRVQPLEPASPVLGVDTMVFAGGRSLGKAGSEQEALEYLRLLSGNTHQVYSGITLIWASGLQSCTLHAVTDVRFAAVSEDELRAYVATGEWRGRAGAYAIQGRASAFVEEIRGDYTNVVGLPVPLLVGMLRKNRLWPAGNKNTEGLK